MSLYTSNLFLIDSNYKKKSSHKYLLVGSISFIIQKYLLFTQLFQPCKIHGKGAIQKVCPFAERNND